MREYKHSKQLLDSAMASIILDLRHEPEAVRELLTSIPKNVLESYVVPADKEELERGQLTLNHEEYNALVDLTTRIRSIENASAIYQTATMKRMNRESHAVSRERRS